MREGGSEGVSEGGERGKSRIVRGKEREGEGVVELPYSFMLSSVNL